MAPRKHPEDFIPLTHISYEIMLALVDHPLHGYAIIKEVARRTAGKTVLETGTLYAAIKRLVDDGIMEAARAKPAVGEDGRRKYYRLTPFGKKVLRADTERMAALLAAARAKSVIR